MITVLAVGKTRQAFVKEGIKEFCKRLQKYAKVEYKEVTSLNNVEGYTIALADTGREYDSIEFATFVKRINMNNKKITFIIGEAQGLPQSFITKCNIVISLSKMTFPTQLVRVIFLEQLYRAFTIIKREPYHKE